MTGPELRAWRKAHNISGNKLAALLKVHRNTVYRWERDERTITRQVEAHIRLLFGEEKKEEG